MSAVERATNISFQLNGDAVSVSVHGGQVLMDVLREQLGQKGTKEGCGQGECGACTVMVDDRAVNACLFPVLEAEGRQITTVEGLVGPGGRLSPVQEAFVERGGIQCGFCSPGMIISATALLKRKPEPTDTEVRDALIGNLCRCTGYVQIVESIQLAARRMREASTGESKS